MSIIAMKGSNGEDIYVEVKDFFEAPAVEEGGGGVVAGAEDYINRFEHVGQHIMSVCAEIYKKYAAASSALRPDEIELKFGVKLGGKAGIPFVSEGSAEGTFEVTAKWNKGK